MEGAYIEYEKIGYYCVESESTGDGRVGIVAVSFAFKPTSILWLLQLHDQSIKYHARLQVDTNINRMAFHPPWSDIPPSHAVDYYSSSFQ
jgi:hypothetical protein